MGIQLAEHQLKAIEELKNGSILRADVGTGKSRTALAYYYIRVCGGKLCINGEGSWEAMRFPRDLYIITTAKKRDTSEWLHECDPFCVTNAKVTVDSWNNIKKYRSVYGAFFIFDEQRVVGYGAWTKAFLDISRKNQWILLTATPGDTWSDYIPVFIANGYYRNKTDFYRQHVVLSPYAKYQKIDHYVNTGRLARYRKEITVNMSFKKKTTRHVINVPVEYNKELYLTVWKRRWDPYDNKPIRETGKLCYLMRRVVNEDETRLVAVEHICEERNRVIVFYNYTYELERLRELCRRIGFDIGEWNGEVHSDVPTGERWAYLVQYSAGCEGWNCVTADTIIFYSQSYSYRMTTQAEGRIDRLNTPFEDLYYYKLKSVAPIDLAISRALMLKKNFNEKDFVGG